MRLFRGRVEEKLRDEEDDQLTEGSPTFFRVDTLKRQGCFRGNQREMRLKNARREVGRYVPSGLTRLG